MLRTIAKLYIWARYRKTEEERITDKYTGGSPLVPELWSAEILDAYRKGDQLIFNKYMFTQSLVHPDGSREVFTTPDAKANIRYNHEIHGAQHDKTK